MDTVPDAKEKAILMDFVTAFVKTEVLHTAVKIGLIDKIADGQKTVEQLAFETSCQEGNLGRLLIALSSIGICNETDGKYTLTSLGKLLVSNSPGSMSGLAGWFGSKPNFLHWTELPNIVKTGQNEFTKDKDFYSTLADNNDHLQAYSTMIENWSDTFNGVDRVKAYPQFEQASLIVDVGGGTGDYLAHVLKEYPELNGVIMELGPVIDKARHRIQADDLGDRVELIAGDFFKADDIPSGADVYILKWILHDWCDAKAATILKNIAEAMKTHSGAKLLVYEIFPQDKRDQTSKQFLSCFYDLSVMVNVGGKGRKPNELKQLIENNGFRITSTTPLPHNEYFFEAELAQVDEIAIRLSSRSSVSPPRSPPTSL